MRNIAAGLIYYAGDEFVEYSKSQSKSSSDELNKKLEEFSNMSEEDQQEAMKKGLEGISINDEK